MCDTPANCNNRRNFRATEDSLSVAFHDPFRCLQWCTQVQLGLMVAEWPKELGKYEQSKVVADAESGLILFNGLRVRMAFTCGVPMLSEDPVTGELLYTGTGALWCWCKGELLNGGGGLPNSSRTKMRPFCLLGLTTGTLSVTVCETNNSLHSFWVAVVPQVCSGCVTKCNGVVAAVCQSGIRL